MEAGLAPCCEPINQHVYTQAQLTSYLQTGLRVCICTLPESAQTRCRRSEPGCRSRNDQIQQLQSEGGGNSRTFVLASAVCTQTPDLRVVDQTRNLLMGAGFSCSINGLWSCCCINPAEYLLASVSYDSQSKQFNSCTLRFIGIM